jgi:hypothetical protein
MEDEVRGTAPGAASARQHVRGVRDNSGLSVRRCPLPFRSSLRACGNDIGHLNHSLGKTLEKTGRRGCRR